MSLRILTIAVAVAVGFTGGALVASPAIAGGMSSLHKQASVTLDAGRGRQPARTDTISILSSVGHMSPTPAPSRDEPKAAWTLIGDGPARLTK